MIVRSTESANVAASPPLWRASVLAYGVVRRLARLLCALLLFTTLTGSAAGPEVAKEYQVKAAFLYNFTKYVEWPDRCFAAADAPFVIGVIGRNPFGGELEKLVRGRSVAGRSIVAVQLTAIDPTTTLHLLFVATGEEKKIEPHMATLRRAGVLTVGESDRFTAIGGIVTFIRREDQVRFEIDAASAGTSGLKVSAQLLKLATAVRQ